MKKNREYILSIIRLLILLLIVLFVGMQYYENYTNQQPNVANIDPIVDILYPTKKLEKECYDMGHYPPSYMPMKCIKQDGTINQLSNCKCVDSTHSYCTSCYPEIHHVEPSEEELRQEYPYMQYG